MARCTHSKTATIRLLSLYVVVVAVYIPRLCEGAFYLEYYDSCSSLICDIPHRANNYTYPRDNSRFNPKTPKYNRPVMKKFTTEEMQVLSQWEPNMRTAIDSKYLRNVGRLGVKAISDIRARQLGVKEVYVNSSCASCILDLLQRVGKDYFSQKEAEADTNTTQIQATAISPEPKKRRTRRPKTKK